MTRTTKSLLLFICLIAGHLTTQAQDKKVAVTSFWVSKHIGFSELGGAAGLAASIASLAEDPDFHLQPVLDNFYKTFTKEYAKQFPFELLSEEDVLEKKEYQSYEGRWNETKDVDRKKILQRYLTPKSYKPLQESLIKGKNSNQMQMVEMFKEDADGVMFVSMRYNFVKKAIPFTAGIRVNVRIKIWNKEGKKVLTINEAAVSKKSVGIVAGVPIMDLDKLLPMCESASEKLVKDLSKKIGKMTKKADKKL